MSPSNWTSMGKEMQNMKAINRITKKKPVILLLRSQDSEQSYFCDIGKFRDINRIEVDQIWALYDDHDFIPRVYARIDHIDISNLKVQFTWLEHKAMNAQEAKWSDEELPVARGSFCLGETCIVEGLLELDTSAHLSSELDSTFLSIALTHYMSLDTRPNTEFTSCVHPVSEFHKSGHRFALNSNRRSNGWSRIHLSVAASLELETANPCVIQIGKLFFFPKVRFEPSTRTGHLIGLLPDSIAVLSMPLARSSGALKAAHTVFSSERLDGYIAVFKLHIGKEILEIPEKENLRFSHRIPSFSLVKEKGLKFSDFYELDPASVPDYIAVAQGACGMWARGGRSP
uniref:DUF3444 domain-containing protein n=1 Tax=Oryza nivara TaxID=4536 RepID=A0A0E0J3I8_ORYNI